MEGPSLTKKPTSNKQEESFLKAAREALLNDFPNPERKGCPSTETIKAIAVGKLTGEEASRWRVHAATCSPCTREYVKFRTEAERAKRVRTLALIAATVVLAVVAGWLALGKFQAPNQSWQQASLDLRGHEPLRGAEQNQHAPPLELARGNLLLTIYLPVGSEPGNYQIQLEQGNGHVIAQASGTGKLVNGLTILKVRTDTREARPGESQLLVRKTGSEWVSYKIVLK